MKMLSLEPFLLLLATLFTVQIFVTSTNGDQNLIIKTCNQTEIFDFCVSALESDPRSFIAEPHGLARITIELCYANATDTHSFIDVLLGNARDPTLWKCLRLCSEVYDEGVRWLLQALDYFDKGDYHGMNRGVLAALDITRDCKDMFTQFNMQSPASLTLRDDMLYNLSSVSLSVTSLLG